MLVLVKYGNFTRTDILCMPIYERRFHIDKLVEYKNRGNATS
jgi:hypothetical protein